MAELNKLTEPAWESPYNWVVAMKMMEGRYKDPPYA